MVPGVEQTRPEGREPEKKNEIIKNRKKCFLFIWVRGAPRTPGDPIEPKKNKKNKFGPAPPPATIKNHGPQYY